MSKPKLFVDFDNTIVNATKAFCRLYNATYKGSPNFTPAQWELVDRYDFKDQCPLVLDVENIFKLKLLFNIFEFINHNTYEVLEQLAKVYQVIIVSIGTYENISNKSLWIKEYLPFIKDSIFLINNGVKMDKSLIDMKNAIFIDDVVSNLNSSNAMDKICFGEIHEWNRDWNGNKCLNWTEVRDKLL